MNLMKCAFSDVIVLAPKLFLLQCFSPLSFPVDHCANSGWRAGCRIAEGPSSERQRDTRRTLQCGTLFVSSILGR